MGLRSIGILAVLGLFGLVLAAHSAHAQGMAPGTAAPPLPTVDLTKPGSGKVTPKPPAASPPHAAVPPTAATPQVSAKVPPVAAKATKPTTVAKTTAPAKKTTKAPPKAAKGKPPATKPPTQTATVSDR